MDFLAQLDGLFSENIWSWKLGEFWIKFEFVLTFKPFFQMDGRGRCLKFFVLESKYDVRASQSTVNTRFG